ncbi:MAG: hypothetical protein J1E99_08450 [Muribaculaceae bacterium]|nr:hypothetical protein [Muribaculaceae bacterium]
MNRSNGLRMLFVLPLIATASLTMFLGSCSDVGCIDNRSSIPYAKFYSAETMTPITVDSLEIGGVGAPNDSLLVAAGDKTSAMYFPFRFEQDNTTFFIRYVSRPLNFPGLVDSISFKYTSNPYFVSSQCGAMYRYFITEMKYTRHLIDSIAILDSLITNVDMERLRIFFRTAAEDEDNGYEFGEEGGWE